jgi:hypothetical protein
MTNANSEVRANSVIMQVPEKMKDKDIAAF